MDWELVATAPYETPVLTYWPGDHYHPPVMMVDTKNNGTSLGKRNRWWNARPDQQPTYWMALPAAPDGVFHPIDRSQVRAFHSSLVTA